MAFLFTSPKFQAFDANGDPLAGGKVYTYDAGTTTPRATYTDQSGGTPNANPVILDAAGTAHIWLDGEAYKFVVTDAADVAAPFGTVDNIRLQEPDPETVFCVDTVAAMKAYAGTAPSVRTFGYYTKGDGGQADYWHDTADTVSADNGGTVIVRSDGARMKLVINGDCLPARQCGVMGGGSSGESAKLLAADVMARGLRKSLLIEGIVLIDEQIRLSNPTHWVFSGWSNHGNTNLGPSGATVSGAWLKVPASMPSSTSAVVVEHPGIVFTHGAIGCDPSFTWPYDGITILANGFRWDKGLVFGMGRDGVVLGSPVGTVGNYNSNSVVLDNIAAVWNGRHGINISDDVGSPDANTFLITSPRCFNNVGHGIRFGKTFLGGTVVTPTVEFNTVGLYFEADAQGILILGGDIEANVGPHVGGVEGTGPLQNIVEVVSGQNFFVSTTVQGVVRNDFATGSGSSPLTTKGDLYAYGVGNTRLPVGANGQVLVADSGETIGLRWAAPGTPTIVNPLQVKEDFAGTTLVDVENLSASSGAAAQVHVQTNRGTGGMWQRAIVDGGEFIFGTIDHAGDIGLMSNGVVRFGFPSDGSLAIGGYSAVGTAGQVLTSGGPGAAVSWSNKGVTSASMSVPAGLSVSGSPITSSGTFAVTWGAGYRAYTDAENTKLAGLPTAAVNKAGDTMTGDLSTTNVFVNDTYPTVIATGSTGASISTIVGTVAAGFRAGTTYAEMGTISGHDLIILTNGTQRIRISASGEISMFGLPTSSPGVSGRIWRDGSNYVRIDP